MTVEMLKGKIHRATVVQAELDYVGSITAVSYTHLLPVLGVMKNFHSCFAFFDNLGIIKTPFTHLDKGCQNAHPNRIIKKKNTFQRINHQGVP